MIATLSFIILFSSKGISERCADPTTSESPSPVITALSSRTINSN